MGPCFYVQLFLEKYGLNEWPFVLERQRMIEFIKCANRSFDIVYNDREVLESSYLLAIIIERTSQGFELSEREKMSLNQALVDKILTLRPAADRIVQNSEYLVTDEWYYEVANSLFCSCFITRFDPTCQHTLGI